MSIRWIYLDGFLSVVVLAGMAFPSLAQTDRRQTAIALEKHGQDLSEEP